MNWDKIKYFKKHEWGKEPEQANFRLIEILDNLRGLSGSKIIINVCWDYTGHSKNSYHYLGNAVDFVFKGELSCLEQYAYISMFPELRGVGFYPDWHTPGWHVDLRQDCLKWVRKNGIYSYDRNIFIKTIIYKDWQKND